MAALGDSVQIRSCGEVVHGLLAYCGPTYSMSRCPSSDLRYWAAGEEPLYASADPSKRKFNRPSRYLVRDVDGFYHTGNQLEGDSVGSVIDMKASKSKSSKKRKSAKKAAKTSQPTPAPSIPEVVETPSEPAQPVIPTGNPLNAVRSGDKKVISIMPGQELLVASCTRRAVTVHLPPLGLSYGHVVTIKRLSGGTKYACNIRANGDDKIDGGSSLKLDQPYQWVTIYADEDRWLVIG